MSSGSRGVVLIRIRLKSEIQLINIRDLDLFAPMLCSLWFVAQRSDFGLVYFSPLFVNGWLQEY